MNWRLILGLILVLLFGVVLAQNAASVSVRFLFWGFYASMIVVILLALVLGFLGGLAVAKTKWRKRTPS